MEILVSLFALAVAISCGVVLVMAEVRDYRHRVVVRHSRTEASHQDDER